VTGKTLVVRGYHGTTLTAAEEIKRTNTFLKEDHPWHWLGYGIYFWQDAELRAWEWAQSVSAEPAVVSADIEITNCLDLLDIKYWGVIEKSWFTIIEQFKKAGLHPPTQTGPLEAFARSTPVGLNPLLNISTRGIGRRIFLALLRISLASKRLRYGNNQRDCSVMNAAVQLLDNLGKPVTTARAAFMEGSEAFDGSWLFDRSHVQIAVVDPEAIDNVVKNIKIESADDLKKKYDDLVRERQATWTRYSKSSMQAR
jgi:hypothetical protein